MSAPIPRQIEILMVEDSPTDALITREAMEQAMFASNLHVVQDGEQAMAFLRREGEYASAPRPDLLLLDLNLPRKSGLEVLTDVKSDSSLKVIPVVILTSSRDEKDVVNAYGLHANCYVVKAMDFNGLVGLVSSLNQFWCSIVTLPPRSF